MYPMEELAPIVGRLADRYCAYESSSVTYERAEQLMGAVLYCIHEAENAGSEMAAAAVAAKGISAKQAYEIGAKLVKQKTKQALELYNQLMLDFDWYGSRCLYDTMVKGMPEFFKWYDCQMEPQNTILTLDYPVLRDLSKFTGIDRIAAFLECIRLEQKFFGRFPKDYVRAVLAGHNGMYEERMENICENVLMPVLEHILVRRPLSEWKLGEEDHLKLQAICGQTDEKGIRELLEDAAAALATEYFDGDEELSAYLKEATGGMAVRWKHAVNEIICA
ncbi:MAG: hypothetical protein K1W10_00585 [Lachnospiraceae bacterium]